MLADGFPGRASLSGITLDGHDAERAAQALGRLFPSAPLGPEEAVPYVTIDTRRWCDPGAELLTFDRLVHDAERIGPFGLRVRGPDLLRAGGEVLLRYQRLFPDRNTLSRSEAFEAVLTRHRQAHDLRLPLVRADHDHTVDTWQWALRLDPEASLAVQIAALCHDLERLDSEAERRVEHLADDYDRFKAAHADAGARKVRSLLADVVPEATIARVATLVRRHEQRGEDPEAALLTDADALSFFSLNSPGYLRWFGSGPTAKKVAWTWRRLGPRARMRVAALRLEPAVRAFLPEGG